MAPPKAKKTMKQRLDSLPQELYDELYDCVIAAPTSTSSTNVASTTTTLPDNAQLLPVAKFNEAIIAADHIFSPHRAVMYASLDMSNTRKALNVQIAPISGPFVLIDKHYAPPPQLQLDQQTRRDFRRDYYANTTFMGNIDDIIPWLKSLELQDWRAMREIRCWAPLPKPEHVKLWVECEDKLEKETVAEQEEYARRKLLLISEHDAWLSLKKLGFNARKVMIGESKDEVMNGS